ncbi:hypothetical protein, partial [Aliiruegeria sabulilitoris]|uniref:hypothetical protein n=1 Tax=Aliiruegeria sabulilitoris TaxID=1510458 RepID=UPI001E318F25
ADDPAARDPQAKTRRTVLPELPASIPSSRVSSNFPEEIESAVTAPNKQSFSTKFRHTTRWCGQQHRSKGLRVDFRQRSEHLGFRRM